MAAHVKTALDELVSNPKSVARLEAALNLSCWTEDLTFTHYCDLRDIIKNAPTSTHLEEDVLDWIKEVYWVYNEEWLNLNQPATREEWRQLKWGAK